ncbi:MAG: YggS family pyridoxal phosphate-dependent enzyme [Bacteroidota bacterium]|nr:YggS family pyridoxal phosphate-dependent enzyme [Bacteroidota bacterium]MDP4233454.1 YggS family pyridoxal phosphate-dependent enzyme [Bacteroidota bacterium]MDP4242320.1 YggS family pyridoxal phosphate-dependent enzyme [Bacteroidota bacterium]MDP4287076.1 YggS family pyridoxal phosphate-dependent enzyme [Bacteroidota bacterium]
MTSQNLRSIESRIRDACRRAGRERKDVRLLPVTKTRSIAAVQQMYDLGLRDFGESRVQELLEKKTALSADIRWHFIGHLQSNKVRQIASFISSVQSIDSIETARELAKRAAEHQRVIRILVEVNISGEAQKQGVAPRDVQALVVQIVETCPSLVVAGLMGMASLEEDLGRTRPQFRILRELRNEIQERQPQLKSFTELSMGMSNDFEIAIEEGATIVRIGSALFASDE